MLSCLSKFIWLWITLRKSRKISTNAINCLKKVEIGKGKTDWKFMKEFTSLSSETSKEPVNSSLMCSQLSTPLKLWTIKLWLLTQLLPVLSVWTVKLSKRKFLRPVRSSFTWWSYQKSRIILKVSITADTETFSPTFCGLLIMWRKTNTLIFTQDILSDKPEL